LNRIKKNALLLIFVITIIINWGLCDDLERGSKIDDFTFFIPPKKITIFSSSNATFITSPPPSSFVAKWDK